MSASHDGKPTHEGFNKKSNRKIAPIDLLKNLNLPKRNTPNSSDSKSSSTTITPVSKTFPRSPFDPSAPNASMSISSQNSTETAATNSLNSSSHDIETGANNNTTTTITNTNNNIATTQRSSQSSIGTLKSTKSNKSSDHPYTPTPKSSKKQSSFSFITQLSDDLLSDVASKAKSTIPTLAAANRKISSILRDESRDSGTSAGSENKQQLQKQDCKNLNFQEKI